MQCIGKWLGKVIQNFKKEMYNTYFLITNPNL